MPRLRFLKLRYSLYFGPKGPAICLAQPVGLGVHMNRLQGLQPDQTYTVGPMQVESSTLGLEHLLVIATKAAGQPLDFSWLSQNSLEAANRGLGSGPKNSLENLLKGMLFSKQNVRGMRFADAEGTCLRAVSWQTISE